MRILMLLRVAWASPTIFFRSARNHFLNFFDHSSACRSEMRLPVVKGSELAEQYLNVSLPRGAIRRMLPRHTVHELGNLGGAASSAVNAGKSVPSEAGKHSPRVIFILLQKIGSIRRENRP